jgi:hypothetical protein
MKNTNSEISNHLVFLTYLNRSGSTYLASKLAEYDCVSVGIEAKFIDGWITPGFSIADNDELEAYCKHLSENKKFQAWHVQLQEFKAALHKYRFPLKFSDLLFEALRIYSGPGEYQLYIHKCGEYYRCVEKIRREVPDARFIFIDRDPRAILNSQLKSIDSQSGKPMQKNILHFVFGYLDTQRIIQSHCHKPYFMVVRYEDLVVHEEKTMTAVQDFLAIRGHRENVHRDYFASVPESQRHLHTNVGTGSPRTERISGWQQELPVHVILLLQAVLKRQLVAHGFSMYRPRNISLSDRAKFTAKVVLFWYEAIKRKIFRIPHRY